MTQATQDAIVSTTQAENLRNWIAGVIEQRIAIRKARRRARWFKAFGIIAMIIAVAATIVTAGGFSPIAAAILGLAAGAIQATISGIQENWFGMVTSIVSSLVSFISIPAVSGVSDIVSKSIQNYGGAVVSAIKTGEAFVSGDGLGGFLEIVGVFASLATEGISQSLDALGKGATAAQKAAHKLMTDTLDALKKMP